MGTDGRERGAFLNTPEKCSVWSFVGRFLSENKLKTLPDGIFDKNRKLKTL